MKWMEISLAGTEQNKEGQKNGLHSCQQEESRVKYFGIGKKQQQPTNLEFCIIAIIFQK